jgi:hypothetical protein
LTCAPFDWQPLPVVELLKATSNDVAYQPRVDVDVVVAVV